MIYKRSPYNELKIEQPHNSELVNTLQQIDQSSTYISIERLSSVFDFSAINSSSSHLWTIFLTLEGAWLHQSILFTSSLPNTVPCDSSPIQFPAWYSWSWGLCLLCYILVSLSVLERWALQTVVFAEVRPLLRGVTVERGYRENSGSDVPVQRWSGDEKQERTRVKGCWLLRYTCASPSRNME